MQFRPNEVQAFTKLSFDLNPLHTDAVYCRTSQFGRPVVYGMCSVLWGIGQWANGRKFQLRNIRGQFEKPLFVGDEYELRVSESDSEVVVRYFKGPVLRTVFRFTWQDIIDEGVRPLPPASPASFQPLPQPEDSRPADLLSAWNGRNFCYAINPEGLRDTLAEFRLHPQQMPRSQLGVLVGSSYFVGMHCPGRHALYSGFEFDFDAAMAEPLTSHVSFENLSLRRDVRINRLQVSGHGTGLRSFSITAYQRPIPVTYDLAEIKKAVGESVLLENRTLFISGATRGFGAVLAKIFALQRATLLLNYRSNAAEAEALAAELRQVGAKVYLVAGDISNSEDCQRIGSEVKDRFDSIDFLILNAFPRIDAKTFLEQSRDEFMGFIQDSLSGSVTPLRVLLPLMKKGGSIVGISTMYTQAPSTSFSHYVTAKAAVEGLYRAISREFRDSMFWIIRPPRMLTDQTNLPFDLQPALSAVEVGKRLWQALQEKHSSGNLVEIDLG